MTLGWKQIIRWKVESGKALQIETGSLQKPVRYTFNSRQVQTNESELTIQPDDIRQLMKRYVESVIQKEEEIKPARERVKDGI